MLTVEGKEDNAILMSEGVRAREYDDGEPTLSPAEETVTLSRDSISQLLSPYIAGRALLLDAVTISGDGNFASGTMTVPKGWDFVNGHFGGVLQGILQIELAQQSAGVLLARKYPQLGAMAHQIRGVECGPMIVAGTDAMTDVYLREVSERRNTPYLADFGAIVYQEGVEGQTNVCFSLKLVKRETLDRMLSRAKKQ